MAVTEPLPPRPVDPIEPISGQPPAQLPLQYFGPPPRTAGYTAQAGPYPPPRQQPPPGPYPPVSGAPTSPFGGQPIYIVKQPASSMATVSLVLSILGLLSTCCSFGVFSIAAVITGHIALKETANGKDGHGQAVAGLIMGYIGILPAVLLSVSTVLGHLSRTGS